MKSIEEIVEQVIKKLECEEIHKIKDQNLFGALSKDRVAMLVFDSARYFVSLSLETDEMTIIHPENSTDVSNDEFLKIVDCATKINKISMLRFDNVGVAVDEFPFRLKMDWTVRDNLKPADVPILSKYRVEYFNAAKPILKEAESLRLSWEKDNLLFIEGRIGEQNFTFIIAPVVDD